MDGAWRRDRPPDTFAARHIKKPKVQNPVSFCQEFADTTGTHAVERHRRMRKDPDYKEM